MSGIDKVRLGLFLPGICFQGNYSEMPTVFCHFSWQQTVCMLNSVKAAETGGGWGIWKIIKYHCTASVVCLSHFSLQVTTIDFYFSLTSHPITTSQHFTSLRTPHVTADVQQYLRQTVPSIIRCSTRPRGVSAQQLNNTSACQLYTSQSLASLCNFLRFPVVHFIFRCSFVSHMQSVYT